LSAPPRLARFLFSLCLHPADREVALGDLSEMYEHAAARKGPQRANLWYWLQVSSSAPRFLFHSTAWSSIMLANYLKLALRNLNRQRLHGAINLASLSLGLAICVLIMLFVRDELTYDRFHEGHETLYQVHSQTYEADGTLRDSNSNGPLPLGQALVDRVPGVEAYTRTRRASTFIRRGREVLEEGIIYVDPDFLTMFSFPLLAGDAKTAIGPNGVVLSDAAARRIFGDQPALGNDVEVRIGGEYATYVVTGVSQPVPANSTFQFDALLPMEPWIEATLSDRRDVFSMSVVQTWIKTRADLGPDVLATGLNGVHDAVRGDWDTSLRERIDYEPGVRPATFHALPLTKVHLTERSDPIYSYMLSALALGILLIACINFMTMAIGRSLSRSTEVGVRKVLGAVRGQLISQFWGEAVMVVVMSTLIGLTAAWFALPWFNGLTNKTLTLDLFSDWTLPAGIFALVLLTGLVAGSYPALVLSSFRPIDVLKSRLRVSGANWFTRSLVTLQFALSVAFIIGTLVMKQQTDYLRDREKGFDTEQVVLVELNGLDGPDTARRFREALDSSPQIAGITLAAGALGYRGSSGMRYDHEGTTYTIDMLSVDHNFVSEMGIDLKLGRDFDRDRSTDSSGTVVVNDALVRAFGMDDPIGMQVPGWPDGDGPTIIGVTSDFNYQSLYQDVGPLVMAVEDYWGYGYMYVRLAPGAAASGLGQLEATWAKTTADIPFLFEFLDDRMARVYASDLRWQRIINVASFCAIFLALLGLFGLTSITVRGRTREIGIRKVLGASVSGLVGLVARDFLRLILVGSALAIPVAYFALDRWLDGFAFRVDAGPFAYLAAIGLVVLAGMGAVGLQSMRAVRADPVNAIRAD
jgi:putative ABC transport system permease protein